MSKLTHLQVDESLIRAAAGESVRSLAHEFHVCESSLRWRFRREGVHPRQLYRVAMKLVSARYAFERLTPFQQRMVLHELKKRGCDALPWKTTPARFDSA